MKRLSMLAVLICAPALLAPFAAAEEASAKSEAKAAQALVERTLVGPLAAKESERGKFSRASLPPQERRVRIPDEQLHKDAAGDSFVTFAVDARHGVFAAKNDSSWNLAAISGCVYVDRGEVFVKSGDRYRPAAFLLGKNLKPAAERTCQPTS